MADLIQRLAAKKVFRLAAVIVMVVGVGGGGYYAYAQHRQLKNTQSELAARTADFQANVNTLEQELADAKAENDAITATLTDKQRENLDLQRDKRRNQAKIDELTKLTTIDPELLKKYSKVYFLSENYAPAGLEDVDTRYVSDPSRHLQVLDQMEPFLERLLKDADGDDIDLLVLSAYRSFVDQQRLKSGYLVTYGTGANSFSAEQGYSEHQLGTAVDFTTSILKDASLPFEKTPAFDWLIKNAYKYGFVLSYPKGNQYYVYEPWHWRFVGEDLARDLHRNGTYFYEMDQRDIDGYLGNIFD